MTIKTYAIHGLSEWHGDVKAGSLSVKVSFTGGTASPSGAVPAYFMTKNPVAQFVIENSKEFKNGFIRLEMQQTIADKHPQIPAPKATGETVKPAENADAAAVEEPESEMTETDGGVQKVKVADKAEAIEWLKENYPDKGYTAVKLRSTAAFETACQECNVKFEF